MCKKERERELVVCVWVGVHHVWCMCIGLSERQSKLCLKIVHIMIMATFGSDDPDAYSESKSGQCFF